MADHSEVQPSTAIPTPPASHSTPPGANSHNHQQNHIPHRPPSQQTYHPVSTATGDQGESYSSPITPAPAAFVRPSDYLRPRGISRPLTPAKPDSPLDRDEKAGLKAIRDFLRMRSCYDVLPLSFRLIELDIELTVKESLNILVQCGKWNIPTKLDISDVAGIVSAPLWDSRTSTYAGLLTVNDYLNVIQYYNLHADKLKEVDQLLLKDLRGVEKILNVKPPETVSASPDTILYDALRKQLLSRARRIPLVSYDSDTQRMMVTSVITQYRILKFIAMNVRTTDMLRKPLSMLKLGTYENIVRCSMETTVLDVIDEMVTRSISSVPVVTTEGVLLNVFEAVDVIEILKSGDNGNLTWTIGKALSTRPPSHPGIYTCSLDDGLDTIFDTIRKSRVHRLVIVDEHNYLKGVLSLGDILHYILVDGLEESPH